MKRIIEDITSRYGFRLSTEKLASIVYSDLRALGYAPCIVNSRYVCVNGVHYSFVKTRSKGRWTVKEFDF